MELIYCWNYTIAGVTDRYDNVRHEHYLASQTSHYGFPPKVDEGYWLGSCPDGYRVLITADDIVAGYCHDSRKGHYFVINGEEITADEWTPKLCQLAKEAELVARARFAELKEEQLVLDAQWKEEQLAERQKQAKEAEPVDALKKARKQEAISELEGIVLDPVHEFVVIEEPQSSLMMTGIGCLLFAVSLAFVWLMFAH